MYYVCSGIHGRTARQSPMIEWRRGVGCEVGLVTGVQDGGREGVYSILILYYTYV